MAHSLNHE